MADAVISVVVNKLSDLLIQQAEFLYGVRDQVQQLRNELIRMRCFLEDADAKQLRDARIRNWVSEIRDVAYDSEDVIETFILRIEEKEKRTGERRGFRAALNRYFCICKKGMKLHIIGTDIEAIQKRLQNISKNQVLYGLQNLGQLSGGEGMSSSTTKEPKFNRRSSPLPDEEDFVGLEDTVKALVKQLTGDEASRRVISIYGMGGLGKTSLAKKLYNHKEVQYHFPYLRSWVCVSQEYNTKDLLKKIIKSFRTPSLEEMKIMEMSTVDDLEKQLHNLLAHNRYLVVIDDVWDLEAWESLKRAFPNENSGGRVLLTTRNKNIAERADRNTIPHELRFLDEHESWELFCNIAFPCNNDEGKISCPSHLESLGKEMVGRCRGLPLGIIILGGLLRNKSFTHEWQKVLEDLGSMLMQERDKMISKILELSYNDLPYELKPCFLHIGLFPEDFVIDAEKLIQLWVAEGFIPEGKEPMEDVGRRYLNDLINRSMIHVETMHSWRGVEECNIHDLVRDLAITKAKEVSFLQIYRKDESTPSSSSASASAISRVRRLAIHSEVQSYVQKKHPHWHLRALMVFNTTVINYDMGDVEIRISRKELSSIYEGFNLLRVLDLGGNTFDEGILPDGIGELIHLRYLGLRKTQLKELPTSIGKLERLQTLDLRDNYKCELPDAVGKLRHLRNFYGCWGRMVQIDTLTKLRTLDWIRFDVFKQYDQSKLTNLRDLNIEGVTCSIPSSQLSLVRNGVNSNCLQSLSISRGKYFYNPISVGLDYCKNLLHLSLHFRLTELPNLLEHTPNLIHLELHHPELKEDPMPTLEKLQNLSYLNLGGTNEQRRMICSATGFPQLKTLHMYFLHGLQEWTIEKGAMPRLRTLEMDHIEKLKEIPEGFKFLTTLRSLRVQNLSKHLEDRWRGEEDSCKIKHIPSVTFSLD